MPGGGSEAVILPALLGGAEASAMPAFLGAAVDSAAIGGLGSLLMGQDPMKGALLGGLTGGIGNALFPQGLGSLFSSGTGVAGDVAGEATSPALNSAMNAADKAAVSAAAPASSNLFSKMLPYAALSGGAMLLDQNNQPKQLGPNLPAPLESKPVMPLNRTQQTVDPRSYLTSGGNRNFFTDINPPVKYYAKGGPVGLGNGLIGNTSNKEPTPYPVTGKKKGVVRYYADGGSSSASSSNIPPMGLGRYVNGRGDGQSDDIEAKLSDGEFVISAPVVSALGNGSNKAGAKKLGMMQKKVIQRHYKGGKPKKSLGVESYVH